MKLRIVIALTLLFGVINAQYIERSGRYSYPSLEGGDSLKTPLMMVETIRFDDGTEQSTAGAGGSDEYTGSSPATVNVGGISVGDSLTGTVSEILEQILSPYVAPQFTSFTSTISSIYEVGTGTAGNQFFTFNIDLPANVTANTLALHDISNSSYLATGEPVSSPLTVDVGSLIKNGAGSQSYRLEATNSQGNSFNSSTITVSWRWKRYFGFTNNSPASNADIISLASDFVTNHNKSYSTATPSGAQYLVFAFPASFGALSGITVNGFPSLASFTEVITNVTNSYGQVESYRIYYSNNTFNSSATVSYE